MSEEQNQDTTQLVNNELTDRVNKAYIANGYTLLNGGTDNIVMISSEKDGEKVDVLFTLDGICEMAEELKKQANDQGNKLPEDNS